jgi:protein-tyrosine phosphatase
LSTFPVRDFHTPAVEQLGQFVSSISALLPEIRTIAHCEGGTGRTGTFAAYWVAKGLAVPDAIARVRKARAHVIEPPG